MGSRLRHVVVHAFAVLVGTPPALFLVFAGVFIHAGPLAERGSSLALVAVTFAALGGAFAWLQPDVGWRAAGSLAAASAAILGLYVARENDALGVALLYLATVVVAAATPGLLVARRRAGSQASP